MIFLRRARRWSLRAIVMVLCAPWLDASATEFALRLTESTTVLPTQVAPGANVEFDASAAVTRPDDRLEWYFDGTLIPGASGSRLSLANVSFAHTGNYRAKLIRASTESIWSHTTPLNVMTPPPSAVDRSFSVAARAGGVVAAFNDGSMLVAPSQETYTRLLTNGSIDASFHYPIGAGTVLATRSNGALLTSKTPYRLLPDGRPDALVLPAGFDPTQPLTAAAAQSDGRFIIGQNARLARINADGSADPSFVFSNANGDTIDWLRVDFQDRILFHTWQHVKNANGETGKRAVLVRLTANGASDAGFDGGKNDPAFFPGDSGSSFEWQDLSPLRDGTYLVLVNSGGLAALHRMKTDGTMLANWNTTAVGNMFPWGFPTDGTKYVFSAASGQLRRFLITDEGLQRDPTFYAGSPEVTLPFTSTSYQVALKGQPNGDIVVYGDFSRWDGHTSSGIVKVRGDVIAAVPPSTFITAKGILHSGEPAELECVLTDGTGPFTYEWLALDGQPLPVEHFAASLRFSNLTVENLSGRYQVRVTGTGGTTLSDTFSFNIGGQQTYLTNLSGRALSGSGENVAIVGFTAGFPPGRPFSGLLRGAGPALNSFGVSNFMPDPKLQLFNAAGTLLAENDNWSSGVDVTDTANRVGAFAFLSLSKDAAITRFFERGNYTAHLSDASGSSSVGLLEIYFDPNPANPFNQALADTSPLVNLSLRARTAPGEATAMAGFVIVDPLGFARPARVLLRAVGPTLSDYGVTQPLADPTLTVFNSRGQVVAQNDDWSIANTSGDAVVVASAMKHVGAFDLPTTSKDSALLLDLPAGAYTIHATGGTGVVLLEIYLVR